jgi:hypothetical protein
MAESMKMQVSIEYAHVNIIFASVNTQTITNCLELENPFHVAIYIVLFSNFRPCELHKYSGRKAGSYRLSCVIRDNSQYIIHKCILIYFLKSICMSVVVMYNKAGHIKGKLFILLLLAACI